MSNQVVLRPLRFTTDVPAMRRFLETLGLKSRVESEHGGLTVEDPDGQLVTVMRA